jgi:hypothetical protein
MLRLLIRRRILDDDSSLSWRQLQVHPVAYRDTSHRCDSTARTGVGGGSVWLRLPGCDFQADPADARGAWGMRDSGRGMAFRVGTRCGLITTS